MSPELKRFFTYWSLTFAVLIFYTFSMIVAGFDVWEQLMEQVRKRRAQLRPTGPVFDPNPLAGKTIAQTLGMGPGQQPDEKRQWVLDRAREVADKLRLPVQLVVLEDNKEHPLVHITDGRQLKSYRVDKTQVAEARGGNTGQEEKIKGLLERYMAADFLGLTEMRPKRTTELAREAASKPAATRTQPAATPAPPAAEAKSEQPEPRGSEPPSAAEAKSEESESPGPEESPP